MIILGTTYDGSSGNNKGCYLHESYRDVSAGDHMPRQLWGPNEIAFLGSTCDGSGWVQIRMAVLGNTCNHKSVDHIRYYWWGQKSMPVLRITCGVGSADHVVCWCKTEFSTIWC